MSASPSLPLRELAGLLCRDMFLGRTNTWFLGDFLLMLEIRRNHPIPTRTLPPFPPPRGWRSFISFHSFIPFICSRLVSFTIPFQPCSSCSLSQSLFHIFPFPSSSGNQSYLELLVSVPIRRCSLNQKLTQAKAGGLISG